MDRYKRFILLTIGAVICAGLAFGSLGVWRARRYLHPRRTRITEEQRRNARGQLPSLEDVGFRTQDGLLLRGWFAGGVKRDAVILVHGLSGNRSFLLPEAEILASHGHGVLMYDSRASGDSDGDLATWGDRERLDVIAALDFVGTRPDVIPRKVGLYGFSVGGSTVALVAASDPRVRAVVLGPTWTSIDDELRYKFRWWGPFSSLATTTFRAYGVDVDTVRPIGVVGAIPPRPLLLLSGSLDEDTPPGVMDRLHGAVPQAERWLVTGAGHGGFARIAPSEFSRRFSGFFDAALHE